MVHVVVFRVGFYIMCFGFRIFVRFLFVANLVQHVPV